MLSLSNAQAPTALVVLINRDWFVPVSNWTNGTTPPALRIVTLLSLSFAAHSAIAPITLINTYNISCNNNNYHDNVPLRVDWITNSLTSQQL